MRLFPKILMEDESWSPTWQPTPQILAWFRGFLHFMADGGTWAAPGSQHVYRISHKDRTVTLLHGDPNHNWHKKNRAVFAALGYRMIDGMEAEQHAFAESLVGCLLEKSSPFDKQPVTLQYRPYQMKDDWKWFWVLLPNDRSKALASGEADSRASAAVQSRLKARKLKLKVSAVEVLNPDDS